MRNKVQVIPLEDLLGQPPLWWRLLRGIGMWFGWLKPQYGGFAEFVVAFSIMLLQAFQVVLVLTFPARFPAEPAWEQAVSFALFLAAYLLTAFRHCSFAKEHWGTPSLPIMCLHFFFPVSCFLLYLWFFS
jgi:hypothetical protein